MPGYPLDVAGPGLFYLLGGTLVVGVILAVGVVIIEAGVLTVMKWAGFWRSLLASFVMNLISGIVGLFVVGLAVTVGQPAWLLLTFLASVLIECGVIALMDRAHARQGLIACLVANIVTYIPAGGLLLALNLLS